MTLGRKFSEVLQRGPREPRVPAFVYPFQAGTQAALAPFQQPGGRVIVEQSPHERWGKAAFHAAAGSLASTPKQPLGQRFARQTSTAPVERPQGVSSGRVHRFCTGRPAVRGGKGHSPTPLVPGGATGPLVAWARSFDAPDVLIPSRSRSAQGQAHLPRDPAVKAGAHPILGCNGAQFGNRLGVPPDTRRVVMSRGRDKCVVGKRARRNGDGHHAYQPIMPGHVHHGLRELIASKKVPHSVTPVVKVTRIRLNHGCKIGEPPQRANAQTLRRALLRINSLSSAAHGVDLPTRRAA